MLQLILGGARSGKSRLAEKLATDSQLQVTYIATSQPLDGEMNERVAHHRARRPAEWALIEEPLELARVLRENASADRCLLVDCLTLWLTNHLLAGHDVDAECMRLAECLSHPRGPWFVVSNEVGLGIVPDNALSRQFRDAAGRLHQRVASVAERVLFMVAGLPMQVK